MENIQEVKQETVDNQGVKQSKVFGILSLALSGACILGIIPVIGAVAGILFGNMAKNTTGEKLGQTGIIISIVCFVLYAVGLIVSAITGIGTAIILIFYVMIMIFMYLLTYSYY